MVLSAVKWRHSVIILFFFFARRAEVGDWRQNKGREIWGEFEETSKL